MARRRIRTRAWTLALIGLVSGCSARPLKADRADVVTLDDAECGAALPGWADLVRAERIVLVGEAHGTNEIPAVVGRMVCQVARSGVPVRLGLEAWPSEGPRLHRFLRSGGGAKDTDALVAGGFWGGDDGRSSHAMLALVQSARHLKAAGLDVGLFACDGLVDEPGGRDGGMARRILGAHGEEPGGFTIVLAGSIHTTRKTGTSWDDDFVPAAARIAEAGADVVTLDSVFGGGGAWTCGGEDPGTPRCREKTLVGSDLGPAPFIEMRTDLGRPGHDGILYIGPAVTSSPPVALSR